MSVTLGRTASIVPLSEGTLTTDGTEQSLGEFVVGSRVSGWVNLAPMQAADQVKIRYYVKLSPAGDYVKYDEATYTDAQTSPGIYLTPKESRYGVKITIEQTAGPSRGFEYFFVKEV